MRASHVEKKGLFAARDRKCRASLIIGCTTTTILERLSFRHRIPFRLPPRPFSFLLVQIFQPAAQKEDPSSSSETSRSKHRLEWNLDRWNGKSTTRPGSRVEELERLGAPGITSSTSDCLSGKGELQVSRGWILFMEEM